MKIYLAGRYSSRDELKGLRSRLLDIGHQVTSRWLDTDWTEKDATGSSAAPAEYREKYAIIDCEDILAADCLVLLADDEKRPGRGGKHVEFGIALAAGKMLIVLGKPENIFHHYPRVILCDTEETLLAMTQDKTPSLKSATEARDMIAAHTPVEFRQSPASGRLERAIAEALDRAFEEWVNYGETCHRLEQSLATGSRAAT